MQLRYNYRLDPAPGQRIALGRVFGCARVVYNDGLRMREDARAAGLPYIKDGDVQKAVITQAKRTPERMWLSEVSSVALIQALNDLHSAYRNFFASLSGKCKGRRIGSPRFRSRKDNRQSIRLTTNGFRLRPDGTLNVAKIGDVRVLWSRPLPAAPSSVTINLDWVGRYFASFVVEVGDPDPVASVLDAVGLDLGLKSFAVRSDGAVIDNPRFMRKAERRLKRVQRALSRKQKGSANRAKARLVVARRHACVTDARRDWLHKESTRIVRENQAVYVEDLNVAGLGRTRLAKSVHDAAWSMFIRMLAYKAQRYGRTFARVSRWAPTSQTCSACGAKDGPKPLNVREWTCKACGIIHDRDLNAAKNVLALGLRESENACGGDGRPDASLAVAGETGTH
jgi:putative transposase